MWHTIFTDRAATGVTYSYEAATTQLRWYNGVLQQAWQVSQLDRAGMVTSAKLEWREIPVVGVAPAPDWRAKYPVGSAWRTRDGSKAQITDHDSSNISRYPIKCEIADGTDSAYSVMPDGIAYKGQTSWCDLIEPWVEPRRSAQ